MNSQKVILDLCGGTGAWSKPYAEVGYDVRNITLPDYDVRLYSPLSGVYGVLAAPPCAEFSLARRRNRFMKEEPPRDLAAGLAIVDACLRIIVVCKPSFWALENPVGLLGKFLGKPNYVFHPWMFGDPWTKRTALWGKFNCPAPIFTTQQDCINAIGDIKRYFKARKLSASIRRGTLLPSKADIDRTCFRYVGMREERSAFRAITPEGFARAFYEANK